MPDCLETQSYIQTPVIEILEIAQQGLPGKSAYQIALENGFVGTIEEWLISLRAAAIISIVNEIPLTVDNINYETEFEFITASVQVFVNGLKQKIVNDYQLVGTQSIILNYALTNQEIILVNYVRL